MRGLAIDERVFFYPHTYLRDRQIDTIRNWLNNQIVNPEIVEQRQGAQVSRDQSLAPRRRSWKRVLPLINIKRRPAEAPDSAIVYLWNGIIANGPFITDIDNPYAFTAYNVSATRLYKPLIRYLLSRSECHQIRCMSKACQQGLADEFGQSAVEKSVLAYPAMAARVASPRSSEPRGCRFLFIGTQFEIKGGPALLRAFREVGKNCPKVRLDLITHLPEQFEEMARDTPGVRVHAANFTREEIASRFLSQADVLIHPTYMDSFGMVVLEAMSFGLPIIATDMYAIPEMVEDGQNGTLITPPISMWDGIKPNREFFSDADKIRSAARRLDTGPFERQLISAMLAFANNPDHRRSAGAHSLDIIRTRFQLNS